MWAHQLPPLRANELAACSAGIAKSTDDGHTWSPPKILQVNNSLGPHYGGNGLNHGIQLQNGPHKGRLAFANRFDCPGVDETAPYWRSYVLYSDDEGETWTTGQLLPEGRSECQIAEMRNGSLLMTSRLQAKTPNHYRPSPDNTTWPFPDKGNKRRAFARSDDGGYVRTAPAASHSALPTPPRSPPCWNLHASFDFDLALDVPLGDASRRCVCMHAQTWAELWYLADRQPEIQEFESECAQGLTSDPATGVMWWAHPGGGLDGHDRSNGTLQRSSNAGGEWEFVDHIGPSPTMGYG